MASGTDDAATDARNPREALLSSSQRQQLEEIRSFFHGKSIVTCGGMYTVESRQPQYEEYQMKRLERRLRARLNQQQRDRRKEQPSSAETQKDSRFIGSRSDAEMEATIRLARETYRGSTVEELQDEYSRWQSGRQSEYDIKIANARKIIADQIARMSTPYDPKWPRWTCAASKEEEEAEITLVPDPSDKPDGPPTSSDRSSRIRVLETSTASASSPVITIQFPQYSKLIAAARVNPQQEDKVSATPNTKIRSPHKPDSPSSERRSKQPTTKQSVQQPQKQKRRQDSPDKPQKKRPVKSQKKPPPQQSSPSSSTRSSPPPKLKKGGDRQRKSDLATAVPDKKLHQAKKRKTADDEWKPTQGSPSKTCRSSESPPKLRLDKPSHQDLVPDSVYSTDASQSPSPKHGRKHSQHTLDRPGRRSPSDLSLATSSSYSTLDPSDITQRHLAAARLSASTQRRRSPPTMMKKCHHCKGMKFDYIRCKYLQPTGQSCKKFYCTNCLSEEYDIHPSKIKKDEWHCPCCLGKCKATACIKHRERVMGRAKKLRDVEYRSRSRRSSQRMP